jgi:sugar phosphate isomerase/epimerase
MFEIGAMLNNLERDRIKAWTVAASLGFRVVHTNALPESWLPVSRGHSSEAVTPNSPELALYVNAARASPLSIHSMFIGFDGQSYADRASAGRTVGLAVSTLRAHRLGVALAYIELAQQLGACSLSTHLGLLPPTSEPDYADLLTTVRDLADACAVAGQTLHLETGQEPAAILLRFLIDVGRANLGVNFDPANFVLYGSDEPLQAVEILGAWVRGVHCKDALPPATDGKLGTEVPLAHGVVDYPRLLQRLVALGYRGPWIIEREHGPTVCDDFLHGRAYLEGVFRAEHLSN